MTVSGINWLNIFFMIASAVVAVKLPFETFLFSYAVLGPLHYLTEINWLKTRNYFLKDTNTLVFRIITVLLLFCLIINTFHAVNYYTRILEPYTDAIWYMYYKEMGNSINNFFLFIAFWIAIAFVVTTKNNIRLVLIGVGMMTGVAFFSLYRQSFLVYFTLFLPTIVHVWLFTGLFVLSGAVKSKSFSGWLSLGVYVFITYLLFDIQHNMYSYKPSTYTKDSFTQSNFQMVNSYLYEFFFRNGSDKGFSLNSNTGLQIQSLIAFAYTYHYLNWFSKTSIIKWHEIDRTKLIAILCAWVASLGLYYYDYKVGLAVLYFISVLHVILEFPLNVIVIKELGNSAVKVFRK